MLKNRALFLALSLAANAALIAALFIRSTSPLATDAKSASSASAATHTAGDPNVIFAALASGNAEAMRAAGVPRQVLLRLAAANAYAKLQALDQARQSPGGKKDGKYWRKTPPDAGSRNQTTPEQDAERKDAEHEFDEAMRAAFGSSPTGDSPADSAADERYPFLAETTRKRVLQIEKDYEDMRSQVGRDIHGLQLPSDSAKFKLLDEEQKRDVLAAMPPEERAQYELRATPTADVVRDRWGDLIQTEEDYKKVFALQKAFTTQFPNEQYPDGPPPPEVQRARELASRQLDADVQAVIGADNLAAYQRANDEDYKRLNDIAARLNLPAGTVDDAYATRETYAARSMQINADDSLSPQQRKDQIAALAAQAKADLEAKLGSDGAGAFADSTNPWMRMLKNGQAFSTNRNDAPTDRYFGDRGRPVYPVAPPPPKK